MLFSRKENSAYPKELSLKGDKLPWVKQSKYLGTILAETCNGLKQDNLVKRAACIDRQAELLQMFRSCHPAIKCDINRAYNCSL